MKSFRVLSVLLNSSSGMIEVIKEITADDNTTSLNLHTFHPETLEWKAAELGLNDPDEIAEGILHEPFIEDVMSLQLTQEAAKTLFRARIADAKARYTPINGIMTIAIKKAKMAAAGLQQQYVDAATNDPLAVIRQFSTFDPEVIEVKSRHIVGVRSNFAARQAASSPTGSERAASLERILFPKDSGSGTRQTSVPEQEAPLPPIVLGANRNK